MKTNYNRAFFLGSLFFIMSLFLGLQLAVSDDHLPIIGGVSIGPAKLGMTEEEIKQASADSPCPVEAIFSSGKAVELRTSWGGRCTTPEGMMASTYSARFLEALYGKPEAVKEETDQYYEGVIVDWWYYYKLGLAFRVMYDKNRNSIVQTIAVFYKGADI